MRVLLVSAATPDTFWSYKDVLSFISKKTRFPPLGLLTVAAIRPKRWDLKLVDLNVTSLTDAQLAWADCVFVSAMLAQVNWLSLGKSPDNWGWTPTPAAFGTCSVGEGTTVYLWTRTHADGPVRTNNAALNLTRAVGERSHMPLHVVMPDTCPASGWAR
jgi:hypothetical protein